jgi:hypothetical protein
MLIPRMSTRSSALNQERAITLHFNRLTGHSLAGSNIPFPTISLLDDEDWSKLTRLQVKDALQ